MQRNPDSKKEVKENKERGIRSKERKPFSIECRFIRFNWIGGKRGWMNWGRYKTEKQRDQALTELKNREEEHIFYRKGEK